MAPKKKDSKKVKDVSKKEKKPGRTDYPIKDGDTIEALPDDFDFAKHKAVAKKFWDADWKYVQHRAEECTWKAGVLEAKALKMKELGSKKDRQRMNRLQKMTAKMEELKKELEESGVDVEAPLAADE